MCLRSLSSPRAESLRRRLQETDTPIVVPGVYDGLTARIAARLGFESVYISGAAAAARRGYPDMSVITLDELVHDVEIAARCFDGGVVVDADTGYGGAASIARCAQALTAAGAAAIQIEDQPFPRRCGYMEPEPSVSIREMLGRLHICRESSPLVVIARTDALPSAGLDQALERVRAYLTAGADLVMLNGITKREQLQRLSEVAFGSIVYNVSGSDRAPDVTRPEARELGVRLVLYPIQVSRVATRAAERALVALSRDEQLDRSELFPFGDYMLLAGWRDAQELERAAATTAEETADVVDDCC